MCTQDSPKKTKVGNIKNQSLKEIWFGKELFEFRKMHLEDRKEENELCRKCDWYRLFPPEDNVDGIPVEVFKEQVMQW